MPEVPVPVPVPPAGPVRVRARPGVRGGDYHEVPRAGPGVWGETVGLLPSKENVQSVRVVQGYVSGC